MKGGVLPTPEDVVSKSHQLGRGWSLLVLSHGAHSIVGEVQFDGVTRADLLGTTRRGDVPQASLRLRAGVRFDLTGSVDGFDVRAIAAEVGISPMDRPLGNGDDERVAVDLELLVALQNTLAQYLGGAVAITPFGPDGDEPLIVFDVVNDVLPNRSPS